MLALLTSPFVQAAAAVMLTLLLRKAWVMAMATVQSVHDQIAALVTEIARVDALVKSLRANPPAGGAFTQADLDAFNKELNAAKTDIGAVS